MEPRRDPPREQAARAHPEHKRADHEPNAGTRDARGLRPGARRARDRRGTHKPLELPSARGYRRKLRHRVGVGTAHARRRLRPHRRGANARCGSSACARRARTACLRARRARVDGACSAAASGRTQSLPWALAGLAYAALPATALVWLRSDEALGAVAVLYLLAVASTADTAAYAVGRLIGGPKLALASHPTRPGAALRQACWRRP